MFGFTGTPILKENASRNDLGKRTTRDLFGKQLHQYVITDAIRDQNVLKFAVEYWGKLKKKDGTYLDETVSSINKKEFFENPARTDGVVQWIIANHGRKTHGKDFTSIFAVSSVDVLIQYYEQFKARRAAGEHDLRVATIFSFTANEEDQDADGLIGEPDFDLGTGRASNKHSRERLDEFIDDYNKHFGTAFSTKQQDGFYNYYKDLGRRIKSRDKHGFQDKDRIDILLVVNMFLTGFDAKKVNTLYVDKNLRHHGLIQAYSRTNRILNEVKSQGNIVCFRSLKKNTDEAIALFSDKNASETILVEPYEEYAKRFNEGVKVLLSIAPSVESVDALASEEEELQFIRSFRHLMRMLNVLETFSEFAWEDLWMTAQQFADYRSKYLDLYEKSRNETEQEQSASIIDEVDFELELIQRDEINVAYILALLAKIKEAEQSDDESDQRDAEATRKSVLDLLGSEAQLRSKRELIEKFIADNLPQIPSPDQVQEGFESYWNEERKRQLADFCDTEKLKQEAVEEMIADYHFTHRPPLRDKVVSALQTKPKILERKSIIERVTRKLIELVEKFDDI
jgi:type I restriction enzyme R subunit